MSIFDLFKRRYSAQPLPDRPANDDIAETKIIPESLTEVIVSAWQSLDAELLAPFLSDDFRYNSVWVSETLVGKDRYLEYLRGKFETLRKSGSAPIADTINEFGSSKPHLSQQDLGVESILDYEQKDGQIVRMLMRPVVRITVVDKDNWPQYEQAYSQNLPMALQVAGKTIQDYTETKGIEHPSFAWLQTSLVRPSFQHLCFRHQSDVYSILIAIHGLQSSEKKDEDGIIVSKQDYDNLLSEAENNNLIPCIAPVALHARLPMIGELNLVNAVTGEPVTLNNKQEQIPMSAWEKRSMGVQVVIQQLEKMNYKIKSYCDLTGIEPQIWFENDGKTGYVLVRSIPIGKRSEKIQISKKMLKRLADYEGYFADVQFASSSPILKDEKGEVVPLSKRDGDKDIWMWRGDSFYVNFTGLQRIEEAISKNSFIEVRDDDVFDIR